MITTDAPARSARTVVGLVLAGFLVLVVSLITLLMVGGGLTWANGRGSAADHMLARLVAAIGLVIFAPIAVTAAVQVFRVRAGAATAHTVLARCATTVGSFVVAVALQATQRGTTLSLTIMIGIAVAFFGIGVAVRRLLEPPAH